jgi:glutaredoxin
LEAKKMPTICPKCNYSRRDTDSCPAWQCPSCQVAYSKVGESLNVEQSAKRFRAEPEPSSGAWKWVVAFVLIVGVVWQSKFSAQRQAASLSALASPAEQTTALAGQPEVMFYTASWCGYCKAARIFFNENRIRYTEYDVETSAEGAKTMQKYGGGGVPLILIGEEVMRGYSEEELRRLLQPWLRPR